MKSEDSGISSFEISQNKVEFHILWNSFPPYPPVDDFSTIGIVAEKIWWEDTEHGQFFLVYNDLWRNHRI